MIRIGKTEMSRVPLRKALRYPVGCWKQFRERSMADRFQYPLAICAIFRQEAPFLAEWIRFHLGNGVSHFFLYNNFSTDDYASILRPWQESGIVTLTDWPVPSGQISAYEDCVKRFKMRTRWMAFIDVDEFLFSPQHATVLPILESFPHCAGVEVWEHFFGTNGHVQRPSLRVTEAYTRRAEVGRSTVKTIANPRMIYKAGIHQFTFWKGTGLDTSSQTVGKGSTPVFDALRINHYWSRSLEDLKTKIQRGDASISTPRDGSWHLEFERGLNAVEDLTIQLRTSEVFPSGVSGHICR